MASTTLWKLAGIASSAVLLAAWAPQRRPAPPPPWPSNLVRVDVLLERDVTATGTEPILTKDDFNVTVDGEALPIASFSSAPAPLSVALLVDVSDSMTGTSLQREFRQAIDDFLNAALSPGDKARMGAIADTLYWTTPFSSDVKALIEGGSQVFAIGSDHGGGSSPIWDSVDDAVLNLQTEPLNRRRAVVIITDGLATGNAKSNADVARAAAVAGISVSAVIERAITSISTYGPGLDQLAGSRTLADTSGGLSFADGYPPAPRNPARYVRTIVDRLRHGYTLGLALPTAEGRTHTLEVKTRAPGMTARARRIFVK